MSIWPNIALHVAMEYHAMPVPKMVVELSELTLVDLIGGFLKWGYPQIIHLTVGFSVMNHPAIGTTISGRPHLFAQHLQLQAETVRQLLLVPLCPTGADFQDHFILQKFLYLMELSC